MQPKWKFVVNLGDANPLEHDGFFLYTDETGAYPPELEYLQRQCDGSWQIYRIVLERCTYQNGILSDNKYHPEFAAWFAEYIPEIASSASVSEIELISNFCSNNPILLAQAYLDTTGYFGWYEFDQYPSQVKDEQELRQRYTQGELD